MNPLQSFAKRFTGKDIPEIEASLLIEGKFSLLSDELKKTMRGISKKPFAAGLLLGEMKGSRFFPSTDLIDVIAKHTDKKVIVNRKSAWLFLCGRDVFGEGIVKLSANSGFVIAENELGEALGYGEVIETAPRKGRIAVKNLFDKGVFLRRERR